MSLLIAGDHVSFNYGDERLNYGDERMSRIVRWPRAGKSIVLQSALLCMDNP